MKTIFGDDTMKQSTLDDHEDFKQFVEIGEVKIIKTEELDTNRYFSVRSSGCRMCDFFDKCLKISQVNASDTKCLYKVFVGVE